MAIKKPTLLQKVDAILGKHQGISYSGVLETYSLTPNQFARAIRQELSDLIDATSGDARTTLEEIQSDKDKVKELFRMDEGFIKGQYDRIGGKSQKKFYDGTYAHLENVKMLVYYALTVNNPKLASTTRSEVIEAINSLSSDLGGYLQKIKLGGLMGNASKEGEQGSPLAVLKVFDQVYQKKTENVSLFDLSQEEHLHEWGDKFRAPRSYWKNSDNVENAIYHILPTHNLDKKLNSRFASTNRSEVIEAINALPYDLKDYFQSIGLIPVMLQGFDKEERLSPLAVLKIFDRVYQRKGGDKYSLFDLSQKNHLHEWGDKFKAPQSYWKNQVNVAKAIYHMLMEKLIENNPQLDSKNRENVMEAIKRLPSNLVDYFYSMGLRGAMLKGFKKGEQDSPPAVLRTFDKVYTSMTKVTSLFDQTQMSYLEFDNQNRLIR